MKVRTFRRALFLVSAAASLALGCELIVDFDRTRIPAEDAGQTDTGPSPLADASDAGDATQDAPVDAPGDGADPDASDAGDASDGGDASDAGVG